MENSSTTTKIKTSAKCNKKITIQAHVLFKFEQGKFVNIQIITNTTLQNVKKKSNLMYTC